MKKELTLQDYIRLLYKRRWILAITTLSILTATALFLIFSPPVYESASTFMLETQNINFTDKGMMLQDQGRPLGYYQAVMRSRIYRKRVHDEFFRSDTLQSDTLKIPHDFSSKDFEKIIQKNVTLVTSEYSDFIQLRVHANNPAVAFKVAHAATLVLKDRSQEIDREELKNAVDFIENQSRISKQKLEETEGALQNFRKKNNITVITEEGGIINELVKMENNLTEIQTRKQMITANCDAYKRRMKTLHTADASRPGECGTSQFQTFRDDLSGLEDRKQKLILQYGDTHPEITLIQDQIVRKKRDYLKAIREQSYGKSSINQIDAGELQTLQDRLVTEEINLFAMESQERYYQKLIEQFKAGHPRIMDQSIELMRLLRAQKVSEGLYNFLLEKGEEAKIQAATGTGGIRIVDDPVMPVNPISRSLPRNLVLGLFLGIGLGFGLALVQEYMDHAIYTKLDINKNLNITVIGEIPAYGGVTPKNKKNFLKKTGKKSQRDSHLKKGVLLNQMAPKNQVAEAFRSLRSNLQFTKVDTGLHSILISSANAEEGKSLTSANLAIAYAMLGKKVILVDTDLRKPRLHKLFQIQSSPGLSECLVEDLPLTRILQKTGVDNLQIMTVGKSTPNPAEIIASQRMKQLTELLSKKAEIVIYDSAPLLPVTDTFILGRYLDGLILVLKHGKTSVYDVDHVKEMLDYAKVDMLGVIINQIPVSRGYGYYYYYGRSYNGYY